MAIPTDLDCMRDDMCWGLWPYLPIKRRNQSDVECGLIWAYRLFTGKPGVLQSPIPVFTAFVYKLPPTLEEFLATKKYEYATLEALVAAGWIIDD